MMPSSITRKMWLLPFYILIFLFILPLIANGEESTINAPAGDYLINQFNSYSDSVSLHVYNLDQASSYNVFYNQVKLSDTPLPLHQPITNIKEILSSPDQLTVKFYGQDSLSNTVVATATLAAGKLDITENQIDECFIATAAYGSKFEPSVALLRQFRDHFLLTNSVGTGFVKMYYKKSPPVAHYISQRDYLKTAVRLALIPFITIAFLFIHPQIFFILGGFLLLLILVRKNRSSKLKWKRSISMLLLLALTSSCFNIPVVPKAVLASSSPSDTDTVAANVWEAAGFGGTDKLTDVSNDCLRIGKDIYSPDSKYFDISHLLASIKYGGNQAYIKKDGKWYNVLTLDNNCIGQADNAEKDYTVNGWSLRYWYKSDIDMGEIVDNDPPLMISAIQDGSADCFILQMNEKVSYPDISTVVKMVRNDDSTVVAATIESFADASQTALRIKTQSTLTEGVWTVRLESISDQAGNVSPLQLSNLTILSQMPPAPILSLTEQDGQTVLSWDAIAEATSYKIKRGESENQLTELAAVTDTSFTDTTDNPNVPYYYAVSAVVNGLESNNSNIEYKMIIGVDQVDENNIYKTNSAMASLTGTVSGGTEISAIKCTYQSILSEQATDILVSGTSTWTVADLPLAIGTNKVIITVTTKSGKAFNKTIAINRVNEYVELSANVVAFDPANADDLAIINSIAQSIINYSTDDMGTPDDLTDDQTVLLVKEICPLVVKLKDNSLDIADIISIPPCQQFLAGLTIEILDFGEPSDFINYPPQEYESLYVCTPGLADLFQGDISMDFSGYINSENPIAFSVFPEGVEIYSEDEAGNQALLTQDQSGASSPIDPAYQSLAQAKTCGMQWGELKRLIAPTASINNNANSCDLLVKFGGSDGVVVYDKDGDLENTKNDTVVIKGEFGIKNLKTTAGVEWHPNISDLLPQQIICKTTYDKTVSLNADFSSELSLGDVVKDANKSLNAGFENKYKFWGMDVSGIDFKDCIVLGAFGIRLDLPPTYLTLGQHQTSSKIVGLSPILLIMPVIDVTGKLEAKLTMAYSYNSYVESGMNIQKLGYTGSYGTLEANRGQQSESLAFNRQLEIYDLEAKSSTNKDEKPAPSLKIECSGTAEASFGAGVMTGLMLNGVVPAAIKGLVYGRAKASLNGSAEWDNGVGPTLEGSGQVGVDVGVRLNIYAKLLAKTGLGNPGFDYTHDWEYHFIDYTLSSISLKGKVSAADGDFDGTNNPAMADVTVTAKKKYAFNPPTFTATTDDQGNYEIKGLSNGTYKVEFAKNGYISYTDRSTVVSTSDKTLNVIMDKNENCSLTGKILIADNDTDMSNNTPLSSVKITARKLAISGSYIYHATSNAMGEYNITGLYPGIYEIKAEKSNYITITQISIIMNHLTSTPNIAMELSNVNLDSNTGIATGKVNNALTGNGIGDISLNARAGLNQPDGAIIESTVTDSTGQYSLTLPAGNFTIEAVDNTGNNAYQSNSFYIKIVGGQTVSNQDGVMTPNIPEGQVRIILRWGSTPDDLDSHLIGPKADGSSDRFHIYYSNKKYSENTIRYADLDWDDISSWGPETTTIYTQTPGKYRFFVHDFSNKLSSNSRDLADSGAFVEVYTSNSAQPLASYYVPYQEGTLWAVFEYDSEIRQITPINTVTYEDSFNSVGALSITDNAAKSDLDIVRSTLLEEK